MEAEILGGIPDKDFFDRTQKTLMLIDDLDIKNLANKEQKHRLNRMFGNWSTHRNITVILCTQDFYECPPIVRRCSNFVILGRSKDRHSRNSIALKIGYDVNVLNRLYNRFVRDQFDTIWFDLTKRTPYPLRSNGFGIIEFDK